jgi:hypothetical protein
MSRRQINTVIGILLVIAIGSFATYMIIRTVNTGSFEGINGSSPDAKLNTLNLEQ